MPIGIPTVTGQASAQGQHGSIINGERLPLAGLVQLARPLVGARLLGQVPPRQ